MNNEMPIMNTESSLPGEQEVETENSPLGETEVETASDNEVKFNDPGESNSEKSIDVPVTGNNSIEVVAIQKGFYNQRRIKEGTEFKMKKFGDLATWVKCKDPAIEKKRVEFLNKKKAKK